MITALLFDPFKNYIQERLDRFFYRKRYDYRSTPLEFGRDLSSQFDLDQMLTSTVDRITRTLLVSRMALFLSEPENPDSFLLAKSFGMSETGDLDLGFLATHQAEMAEGHVHELHAAGVRSASGDALLHDAAYYTLFYIPKS